MILATYYSLRGSNKSFDLFLRNINLLAKKATLAFCNESPNFKPLSKIQKIKGGAAFEAKLTCKMTIY
jgi:hypothetical protein